jgi:predicted ATPase
VGSKGEHFGEILARAYQDEDKALYEKISRLISDYFGYELLLKDLGNNYFQLMLKDKNGVESNLIDVGFGISQVLPIISEVCMSSLKRHKKTDLDINNIILVEQPELHLHPAAQAKLADLFEMCISANENVRFVIETHSEHLISKLQVLIADESYALTSDMVQILYVDKNENGEAFVQEMKIKENGKFADEWPSGFFDQGYTLARQLARASMQRGK